MTFIWSDFQQLIVGLGLLIKHEQDCSNQLEPMIGLYIGSYIS